MSDIHIDDFFHDAAKTLVMLYKHFPRKSMLYVEDISGPDSPDEFGLHSARHEACFHCLLWLVDSGYFKYEQMVRQEAVDQAVLTHRGFLLLTSPFPAAVTHEPQDLPPGIAQEHTLTIHYIREELKHGTSFSLAQTMRTVLDRSRSYSDHTPMIGI